MAAVNTRAEIDTKPPFESVKEAVDRFGGGGPWIPRQQRDSVERAMQLEKEVIRKQQQALSVLKELESTRCFVESLKMSFMQELSSSVPDQNLGTRDRDPHAVMFMELNQAKLNLHETSLHLAQLHASVEGLNKKLGTPKLAGKADNAEMISAVEGANFEAEQFRNLTEASRYEVMKAMSEIEVTKNSIKMAEMRLDAARKMEDAAEAVEAIAIAESQRNPPLSVLLTQKAKQAEQDCSTKFVDTIHGTQESMDTQGHVFRSTASSTGKSPGKREGRSVEYSSTRGHVSLSQMLSETSEAILQSTKTTGDRDFKKQRFVQRRKFGFIQVPLSTIKKTALNMR